MVGLRILLTLALAPSLAASFVPRAAHIDSRGTALPQLPTTYGLCRRGDGMPAPREAAKRLLTVVGGAASAPAAPQKGKSLWGKYQEALETKPLVTKALTSAVICGAGDILSQLVIAKAPSLKALDKTRLLIFSIMGGLYIGPVIHYWFKTLDDMVNKPAVAKRLPRGYGAPLLMLAVDQTVGAAMVNSGFFLVLWLAQATVAGTLFPLGETFSVMTSKLSREFFPMLMANWRLWPFANLINFAFVPLRFRVLFTNVVSLAWNMYLSSSANR